VKKNGTSPVTVLVFGLSTSCEEAPREVFSDVIPP
jgi:hypothetical protein